MVPSIFANYFLATAGSGGALIGLLFVAVSINPERTFGRSAPRERQGVAASAFSALVNAFFISLGALIPGSSSLAGVVVVMASLGLISNTRLGVQQVRYQMRAQKRRQPIWLRLVRTLFTVVGGMIIYSFELVAGVRLIHTPSDVGDVYPVAVLILCVYGLGLVRAWQLLGAPRGGLLSWLSPLADIEEIEESEEIEGEPAGGDRIGAHDLAAPPGGRTGAAGQR